jgi:hypothetical protein
MDTSMAQALPVLLALKAGRYLTAAGLSSYNTQSDTILAARCHYVGQQV